MAHPLDDARERLLSDPAILDRDALLAKIKLADLKRDDQLQRAFQRVTQEQAARGGLGSSVTLQRCWEPAVEAAEHARDAIIAACFASRAAEEHVVAFVTEDMKHSLSAFMMSRFGHNGPTVAKAVQSYAAQAATLASRVQMDVRSYYFDQRVAQGLGQPTRLKSEKFGILDSPSLLKEDMAKPHGALGRAVVYFDLDGFKEVNSRFTERVVDKTLLPAVQRTVERAASFNGYAYAEGGDEMVIFLPNASPEMAVSFAAALRALIADQHFDVEGNDARLTASVGVAYSKSLADSELVEAANRAKRHAKDSGKDCVVVEASEGLIVVDPPERRGAA